MSAINIQPSRDGEHRADRAHPVTAADLLGGAMSCFCETASEPGSGGGVLVLRVTGEIDVLTLPVVRDALRAAVARHPADLVVDLAGGVAAAVTAIRVRHAYRPQLATSGEATRYRG